MIKLMHNGLQDLLLIDQYIRHQKIEFLSIETPLPNYVKKLTSLIPIYSIGLHLRREYRHLAMGLRAWQNQEADALFIFEIYLQNIFIVLPMLAWQRKTVYLSLHWNQQLAMHSRLKFFCLMYLKFFLKYFNFKAVLFEVDDDVIPEKFRLPSQAKIVTPMPIRSDAQPNLKQGERIAKNKTIKIGVVGMIRQDKPIAKLIEKLKKYTQSSTSTCELLLGVPLWQKPDNLEQWDVKIYDTTTEKQYIDLLNEIDILVAHYDEKRYYYRTSGVLSDAACCGCYVITSDYPAIHHQVNFPVKVGATFQDFNELPFLLDQGINFIHQYGQDNQWLWREKRTAQEIAKILFESESTDLLQNSERNEWLIEEDRIKKD